MASSPRAGLAIKAAQLALVSATLCLSTAASGSGERFESLGHKMMCICSCAQLLGECNHVGCPYSGNMRKELTAAIDAGTSDAEIMANFATKYGATVLAAPTTRGFDLVAWIAPVAVFAAALLGTILLVRRWSIDRDKAPVRASDPAMVALRERIRRETDAGTEGGVKSV